MILPYYEDKNRIPWYIRTYVRGNCTKERVSLPLQGTSNYYT